MRSIMFLGHAVMHAPHEIHLSGSTFASLFVTSIAFSGQTALQSPQPRQAYEQALFPPKSALFAAQVGLPLYSNLSLQFSAPPLHFTTATVGSSSVSSMPKSFAISAFFSGEVTWQSARLALPSASFEAKPLQPEQPQPPQLAPAKFSQILVIFSSISTLNTLPIKSISAPITSAEPANIPATMPTVIQVWVVISSKYILISSLNIREHRKRHTYKASCYHGNGEARYGFWSLVIVKFFAHTAHNKHNKRKSKPCEQRV